MAVHHFSQAVSINTEGNISLLLIIQFASAGAVSNHGNEVHECDGDALHLKSYSLVYERSFAPAEH